MPLRITINENNIKCLRALVAIERLFYGKNPFHLVVKARIRELFPKKSITMEHTGPRNRNTFVHHVESARSRPRIACTRQ